MPPNAQEHWEAVYQRKLPTEVSWFQAEPALSLALIDCALGKLHGRSAGDARRRILDVGGGASMLVDRLIDRPDARVGVLDISARALRLSRERLGDRAVWADWIVADITMPIPALDPGTIDVWHDRAVFHFLTDSASRAAYLANLERSLRPGGTAIIAAFAPDGPTRCSDLDVCRHDGASIARELEPAGMKLVEEHREDHSTPWGAVQKFVYAVLERRA